MKWCGLNEEYPSHTKNFEWVQRGLKTDDECEDDYVQCMSNTLSLYLWYVKLL